MVEGGLAGVFVFVDAPKPADARAVVALAPASLHSLAESLRCKKAG